jgi:hypothetical protein
MILALNLAREAAARSVKDFSQTTLVEPRLRFRRRTADTQSGT